MFTVVGALGRPGQDSTLLLARVFLSLCRGCLVSGGAAQVGTVGEEQVQVHDSRNIGFFVCCCPCRRAKGWIGRRRKLCIGRESCENEWSNSKSFAVGSL